MKAAAIIEKVKVNNSVNLPECFSIKADLMESFSEIQIAGESENAIKATTKTKKITILVIDDVSTICLLCLINILF